MTEHVEMEQSRSSLGAVAHVLAMSLVITLTAAALAPVAAYAAGVRWSFAFVILRWVFIAVLLVTPVVHQVMVRRGASGVLPWAMRTPATALVLTCESIGFDILSARLGS